MKDKEKIAELESRIATLLRMLNDKTNTENTLSNEWLNQLILGLGEKWDETMLHDRALMKSMYTNIKMLNSQVKIITYINKPF